MRRSHGAPISHQPSSPIETRLRRARRGVLHVGVMGIFATAIVASLFSHGGYYSLAGGLLGAAAIFGAMAALLAGAPPRTAAIAATVALVALAVWALLSTTWGGLPFVALDFAGLLVTGAACLLLGSSLGRRTRKAAIAGVTIGLAGHAAVTLFVVAIGAFPARWFDGRQLEGSVGYHNALGTAYALGVPLTLWFADDPRRALRFFGMGGAGLLVAAALLTQSRGTALAIAMALILVATLSRSGRMLADVLALIPAVAGVFLALRPVDNALVEASVGRVAPDQAPLTRFTLIAFAVAAGLGLLMALAPTVTLGRGSQRRMLVVSALGVLAAIAAAAVVIAPRSDDLLDRLEASPNSPSQVGGGSTRLTSISATGRLPQWRVALTMIREEPLHGHGSGEFARRWGIERDNKDLYVLQPHSVELETTAELGAVGAGLLVLTVIGLAWLMWIRPGTDRRLRAAVAAAVVPFVLLASVDWVFSFPLLLGTTLLLVGVAGGPGSGRRSNVVGVMAATLLGVGVLAGPALGSWYLERARNTADTSAIEASRLVARARTFDRWNPSIISFQGLLLEEAGSYERAAELYKRAADLSQQPWLDLYRRARALQGAGRIAASRRACRASITANPLEPALRSGVCADVAV